MDQLQSQLKNFLTQVKVILDFSVLFLSASCTKQGTVDNERFPSIILISYWETPVMVLANWCNSKGSVFTLFALVLINVHDDDTFFCSFFLLQNHASSWPFQRPVEISEAPDYYDHIKYPMGMCCRPLTDTLTNERCCTFIGSDDGLWLCKRAVLSKWVCVDHGFTLTKGQS